MQEWHMTETLKLPGIINHKEEKVLVDKPNKQS
jgi:hypothetical protein